MYPIVVLLSLAGLIYLKVNKDKIKKEIEKKQNEKDKRSL